MPPRLTPARAPAPIRVGVATATPGALWLHSGGTDHYAHVHLPGPSIRYLPLPRPGKYFADVTVRGHTAAARLPETNWRRGAERWIIRLITP